MRRKRAKPRTWENPEVREAFRESHLFCQVCGKGSADHIHHILRRGWIGADEEYNLLAACWQCHERIHALSNRGKVIALHAKFRAGELDLGWYGSRPGFNVAGMLSGTWRLVCEPDEVAMIDVMMKTLAV